MAAQAGIDRLARRIAPVTERARGQGIRIIHAPSYTTNVFYGDTEQRRIAREARTAPLRSLELAMRVRLTPRTGCPDSSPCREPTGPPWPWTRQHEAIRIAPGDAVSEDGDEIRGLLRKWGIERTLILGAHTDQCIIERSFGLRSLDAWDMPCALVRDLSEPFWPDRRHAVIEQIETHLAPTVLSSDLR